MRPEEPSEFRQPRTDLMQGRPSQRLITVVHNQYRCGAYSSGGANCPYRASTKRSGALSDAFMPVCAGRATANPGSAVRGLCSRQSCRMVCPCWQCAHGCRNRGGGRRHAGVARAREVGPRASEMTRRAGSPSATGAATVTTRCRLVPRRWTNPSTRSPHGSCASTCERCGKERMFNQVHSAQAHMLIRDILAKRGHERCGGLARQGGAALRHRGRQQPAGAVGSCCGRGRIARAMT